MVTAVRSVGPARVLALVLAVGQLVSPLFLFIGNAALQTDGSGEPPIVPAGYTFAIWALICILGAAHAVWQLSGRGIDDADARLREELAWPLAGVYAGFSLWLVFASTTATWVTVVIFAVMLVLLLQALRTARAHRERIASWSRIGRGLTWGVLGIYTGWTSVAVWVNLTTALVDLGAPTTGTAGTFGQLGTLAAATATACLVAAWTGGLLPFSAAAAWALLGATIGAAAAGATLLAATAAVGLAVLVATTLVARRATVRVGRLVAP